MNLDGNTSDSIPVVLLWLDDVVMTIHAAVGANLWPIDDCDRSHLDDDDTHCSNRIR